MKTIQISVPVGNPRQSVLELMRSHVASAIGREGAERFHIISGATSARGTTAVLDWQFQVTAPDELVDRFLKAGPISNGLTRPPAP